MPQLNDQTIRRRLPHPVAAAWQRVSTAPNDADRINRLIACNEIVLRTLVAMLLPDYLRGPVDEHVENAIKKLEKPSGGTWLNLVRSLIRALGTRQDPNPFIPQVREWYYTASGKLTPAARALDTIVQMRNLVVHDDAVVTPARTKESVTKLQASVHAAISSMDWMLGYRPFRVLTIEPTRRKTFTGKVQFLTGLAEENEPKTGEWDAFLVKDSVYLANPGGTALLELSPFLEVMTDPRTGQEHLYLIKDAPGLRQLVRAHEGSGSQIISAVTAFEEEVPFDEWLATREKMRLHQDIKTSNGVFRAGSADSGVREPGDLGSRFNNLGELGRGGMATVYRVYDRQAREEAALKVLSRDLSEEENYRKRFRREAEKMRDVEHECVVRMTEVTALPSGQPCLKMPVMKNGSLHERIMPGRGSAEADVRRWADNALSALEQVHAAGITHRDIKPSNLLLADDGRAMLTDFGIALSEGDERLTRTLEQMGTVAYMSPEQRTLREVTKKADIYSLGVVLHELLTGELPETNPGIGIATPFGELIATMGATSPGARPTAAEALHRLRALPPIVSPAKPAEAEGTTKKPRKSGTRKPPAGRKPGTEPVHPPPPPPVPTPVFDAARHEAAQRELALRTRNQKLAAVAILVALFFFNYFETSVETWFRTEHGFGIETEQYLGEAAHWFERGLDFAQHDATNIVASRGFSAVYFFVFPLLTLGTVVFFAMRRDAWPLLLLTASAVIDYLIALPFFLFLPIPERWAYPESNAILLSDLWTTALIGAFRPFSGLNNCFPSFHVSATVIVMACLFRARIPYRNVTIPAGLAIVLSTFALGIHWIPDILAGIASGLVSVWMAERLLRRWNVVRPSRPSAVPSQPPTRRTTGSPLPLAYEPGATSQ